MSAREMVETRTPCKFGEVIQKYHPYRCECGAKGKKHGDREVWVVGLDDGTPPRKTHTEFEAIRRVNHLRSRGTWNGFRA